MTFTLYSLCTSPMTRVLARLSRKFSVTLSTGKKVYIRKGLCMYSCSYETPLSELEEFEYTHVLVLIGL